MAGAKKRKRLEAPNSTASGKSIRGLETSTPSGAVTHDSTNSEPELCARCLELGVHEAFVLKDAHQDSPNISNVVMRRLVFDQPSSLRQNCTTCSRLTKLGNRQAIEPSRVSRRDLSSAEIEEIKSKSSYSFSGIALVFQSFFTVHHKRTYHQPRTRETEKRVNTGPTTTSQQLLPPLLQLSSIRRRFNIKS